VITKKLRKQLHAEFPELIQIRKAPRIERYNFVVAGEPTRERMAEIDKRVHELAGLNTLSQHYEPPVDPHRKCLQEMRQVEEEIKAKGETEELKKRRGELVSDYMWLTN
jgi:hypothetical protein